MDNFSIAAGDILTILLALVALMSLGITLARYVGDRGKDSKVDTAEEAATKAVMNTKLEGLSDDLREVKKVVQGVDAKMDESIVTLRDEVGELKREQALQGQQLKDVCRRIESLEDA